MTKMFLALAIIATVITVTACAAEVPQMPTPIPARVGCISDVDGPIPCDEFYNRQMVDAVGAFAGNDCTTMVGMAALRLRDGTLCWPMASQPSMRQRLFRTPL